MRTLDFLDRVDSAVMRFVDIWAPLAAIIVAVAVGVGATMIFIDALTTTPHVYFDYVSDECVMVESPDPSHSCENIPSKFVHHWVVQ